MLKNKKFKNPMLAIMGLAVVATSFVMPNNKAHALTSSDSQYDYKILSDGTAEITKYKGWSSNVSIPSTIDGNNITSIGSSSFYNKSLTSVTIPNGIKNISSSAFQLNQLSSLSIPNSVITIGGKAFQANNITSVTIGDGVKTIGDSAFYSNSISYLKLGKNVENIGDFAFSGGAGGNKISTLTLPNKLKTIGNRSFSYDTIAELIIPSSVENIGQNAFERNKITKFTVKSPNTLYGTDVLVGNPELDNPSAVTVYGYNGSTSEAMAKDNGNTFVPFTDEEALNYSIENATYAVEKVEETLNQDDLDNARSLVSDLSSGTVKTDLTNRLDVVQNKINQQQAITDATNAVTLAESTKTVNDFTNAQTLVNALPDGTDKTALQNRLNAIQDAINKAQAVTDATNAVVKAENSKSQADVDTAKTLVNALPDGTVKTDLTNRLDKVQEEIDKANDEKAEAEAEAEAEATQATEKAESTVTQDDVDKAKELVNKLPDGTVKDDLTNRLDKVQEEIDKDKAEAEAEQKATEATEKAEASKTQEDVDTAKELVNKLPDGSVKDDLTNRLDKVQEAIDKANTPTIPDTNGGGSANGETALAGTSLNQDISVLVKGGELSLTNSDVTPFKEIELGERTKTVSTNFTAPFTVKDLTGNQLGYRVDVSATQFTDGTNVLPKGTLSLEPVQKIERVGTGIGNSPVSRLEANQILDDGQSTLISANVGEGMGVFDLTFPDNALSISVNPTTTKIDGDSAVYTSTITWDLVQAP